MFICSDPHLDFLYASSLKNLKRFCDSDPGGQNQDFEHLQLACSGACYGFGDAEFGARKLRRTASAWLAQSSADTGNFESTDKTSIDRVSSRAAAFFICSVLEQYQWSGDGSLLAALLPTVWKALQWLESQARAEDGLLIGDGSAEADALASLEYLLALHAAERLLELSGDDPSARTRALQANSVAAEFERLFWSEYQGFFCARVLGDKQSEAVDQEINSLALLAGIGSELQRDKIAARLLSGAFTTQNTSPTDGYLLAEGLASIGCAAEVLQQIQANWQRTTDSERTFWPALWLMRRVLGVTPREPGFATVDIAPQLCGLDWAKGTVRIPQGEVEVSWLRADGNLMLDVTVPTGVLLRPILPSSPGNEILIDGQSAREDQIVQRTSHATEIAVLPGSSYRFVIARYVSV